MWKSNKNQEKRLLKICREERRNDVKKERGRSILTVPDTLCTNSSKPILIREIHPHKIPKDVSVKVDPNSPWSKELLSGVSKSSSSLSSFPIDQFTSELNADERERWDRFPHLRMVLYNSWTIFRILEILSKRGMTDTSSSSSSAAISDMDPAVKEVKKHVHEEDKEGE